MFKITAFFYANDINDDEWERTYYTVAEGFSTREAAREYFRENDCVRLYGAKIEVTQ